jgi:hypothetical protein
MSNFLLSPPSPSLSSARLIYDKVPPVTGAHPFPFYNQNGRKKTTHTSNASSVVAAIGPQDSMDHPTVANLQTS